MSEILDSKLESLHATQTASSIYSQFPDTDLSTPTPVEPIPTQIDNPEDMRSQIIPGTWIWNQLAIHFPELTTLNGLSDEVTQVIFDELGSYKIKTRTLGEYWLITSGSNDVVVPVHFPVSYTATPEP
jgi:hypothetical protein